MWLSENIQLIKAVTWGGGGGGVNESITEHVTQLKKNAVKS